MMRERRAVMWVCYWKARSERGPVTSKINRRRGCHAIRLGGALRYSTHQLALSHALLCLRSDGGGVFLLPRRRGEGERLGNRTHGRIQFAGAHTDTAVTDAHTYSLLFRLNRHLKWMYSSTGGGGCSTYVHARWRRLL